MSLYSKIIDRQKLKRAWENVRKNKPACGVDHVTWEMFDRQQKEMIQQLNLELSEHQYTVLPVKQVTIYKNEKARTIALFAMRDKTVQQSIAAELNKIYDSEFSDSAFAYRPHKSALAALDRIDDAIAEGKCSYYFKADISHFFDSISADLLKTKLMQMIKERDVIDLLIKNATAPIISEDGELIEMKLGLHQGSSTAPILSNIYMMDFDHEMSHQSQLYIRYSDDILFLCKDREEAEKLYSRVILWMEELKLKLNEKKTIMGLIDDEFEFLGYRFGKDGRKIAQKAEDGLVERLETMWFQNRNQHLDIRFVKAAEIIGGWEQYFREKRNIHSIYEFATVAYLMEKKKTMDLDYLKGQRKLVKNDNRELMVWLSALWKAYGEINVAVFEFEEYYQLSKLDLENKMSEESVRALLEEYDKIQCGDLQDGLVEIMQIYSDECSYNKAAEVMALIQKEANNKNNVIHKYKAENLSYECDAIIMTPQEIEQYAKHFVGREDLYAIEEVNAHGRRICTQVLEPLTQEVLKEHLLGTKTIATYVQRNNSTAKFFVIDLDISKRILLMIEKNPDKMQLYLQKCAETAGLIQRELQKLGLKSYIENSGYRGFHIWILFCDWIPVRYFHMFQDLLETVLPSMGDEFTIEYFPNRSHIRNQKYGQCIKLPFGLHTKSGRRSSFMDDEFVPVKHPESFSFELAEYSFDALKRILGSVKPNVETARENPVQSLKLSDLGDLSQEIQVVLEKCNLMKYLCLKAKNTGYLTHFERQSILYVFGHMGEEGEEFVHKVMQYTMNYQYQVTQKFISKIPEKPISCIK